MRRPYERYRPALHRLGFVWPTWCPLLNDFEPLQIGFVLLEIGTRAEMRARARRPLQRIPGADVE
jgi:hypothetical protein